MRTSAASISLILTERIAPARQSRVGDLLQPLDHNRRERQSVLAKIVGHVDFGGGYQLHARSFAPSRSLTDLTLDDLRTMKVVPSYQLMAGNSMPSWTSR